MNFVKNQRGAVLGVVMTLLLVLTVIAGAIYVQSRGTLQKSGQERGGKVVFAAAESALNRKIDWIETWFRNSNLGTDPLVFINDPTATPPTYLTATSTGNVQFSYIPNDPNAGDFNTMVTILLQNFATLFNDPLSYPAAGVHPGYDNPNDPNLSYGTFFYERDTEKNLEVSVYAESVQVDAGGNCIGSGTPGVACIEQVSYRGTTVPGLQLRLHARASTLNGSRRVHLSRKITLTPVEGDFDEIGFLSVKPQDCMLCHLQIAGTALVVGQLPIAPHSGHINTLEITGDLKIATNYLMDKWPYPFDIKRFVDCHPSSPQSCVSHSTFGDVLEDPMNPGQPLKRCGIDSVECYYKDADPSDRGDNGGPSSPGVSTGGGDPFNGSQSIGALTGGTIVENAAYPDIPLVADIPFLRSVDEMHIPSNLIEGANHYRPSYDTGTVNPNDYVQDNRVKIKQEWADFVDNLGPNSYVRGGSGGSATHAVRFSTGKTAFEPSVDNPTDPYWEKGTLADLKTFSDNTDPNVVEPGYGYNKPYIYDTSGTINTTIQIPAGGGLNLEGHVVLEGEIEACGALKAVDVVLKNVTVDLSNCPSKQFSIIAENNVYVYGDFVDANGPALHTAAGQPQDPAGFKIDDFTNDYPDMGQTTIFAGGNAVFNNPSSKSFQALAGIVSNANASATIPDPAAGLTGTENFLVNDILNPDNAHSYGVEQYTNGFREFDNVSSLPRNALIEIYQVHSPATAVYGQHPTYPNGVHTKAANLVSVGLLPTGGMYDHPIDCPGSGTNCGNTQDSPYYGGWLTSSEMDRLFGVQGQGPEKDLETRAYETMTHEVHATVIAESIIGYAKARAPLLEGSTATAHPVNVWVQGEDYDTAEHGVKARDGLNVLGALIAFDLYPFFTGTAKLYADPRNGTNPILSGGSRTVVAEPIQREAW